jgi:hypothetical protein
MTKAILYNFTPRLFRVPLIRLQSMSGIFPLFISQTNFIDALSSNLRIHRLIKIATMRMTL